MVSVSLATPDYDATTAALLAELKRLLSVDFAAHDARLSDALAGALGQVSAYTGLVLVPTTATIIVSDELAGWMPPVYPLRSISSVVRSDGTLTTVAALFVAGILRADLPPLLTLTLTIEAGYTELPVGVQEAVLQCAARLFDPAWPLDWTAFAKPFRRLTL